MFGVGKPPGGAVADAVVHPDAAGASLLVAQVADRPVLAAGVMPHRGPAGSAVMVMLGGHCPFLCAPPTGGMLYFAC